MAVRNGSSSSAANDLPKVLAATLVVVVMPVAVVWVLRARGTITSSWTCMLLAVALTLIATLAGSAYWQRRPHSGDVMFRELLLWGWIRRVRVERRLTNAIELLGLADARVPGSGGAASVEERSRLLQQLAEALESQDAYTIGHSRRVARHAARTARRMGLPEDQVATIQTAAALHDVGKLHVPREILHKPARLTDAEFDIVQSHAAEGAAIVSCLGDPELTAIVHHHHERLDGSGYPAGLEGTEIPVGARVVAVADTFDAITSGRAYRPASPQKHAFDVLRQESGTRLDPVAVQAFVSGYSVHWPVAVWTALAILPQRAFAWARTGGGAPRPSSPGQKTATAGVMAAIAALALAAPGEVTPVSQPTPPHATSAVPPVTKPHVKRAARRPPRKPPVPAPVVIASAVAPSSTCQAYNPQLCTIVAGGEPSGAGGSGSGYSTAIAAGGSATGGTAGGSTSGTAASAPGTLPFTGVDAGAAALVGVLLIATGTALRRLSPPTRRRGVTG